MNVSGISTAGAGGSAATGTGEEEGPRGGRRKLFTQLSESEKSMRRSTLGTASLSQAATTAPPAQAPPTGQMASASTGTKAVLFSRPNQPAAAVPELETPFAKMVRQSGTTTANERAPGPPPKSGGSNELLDVSGISRRTSTAALTAEEKKTRRKSLLAPVQNLFAAMSGDNATSGDPIDSSSGSLPSNSQELKRRKSIFGKRDKGLDFQTGLQLDDSQAKLQRERQKKLQKELDKIEKEKAKQEKARQSRLLDVLQQTLELGEERAQIPMPSHRNAFAMPMRPPIEA